MELLSAKHSGIPPTLRDDRLSEEVRRRFCPSFVCSLRAASALCLQAEQLRQHYMTKYDHEVADAHQALQPVLQNIKELKRQVGAPSLYRRRSSVCRRSVGGPLCPGLIYSQSLDGVVRGLFFPRAFCRNVRTNLFSGRST